MVERTIRGFEVLPKGAKFTCQYRGTRCVERQDKVVDLFVTQSDVNITDNNKVVQAMGEVTGLLVYLLPCSAFFQGIDSKIHSIRVVISC